MGRTSFQLAALDSAARRSTRATFVVLVAFALLAVTLFTPAMATSTGDDLESVRSTVSETYTYKIELLTGLRDETTNTDRKAIYESGIGGLANVRDTQVATEQSIDALWALKDQAHSIYHATVDAATQAGKTPAEELDEARRAAAKTIEYKIGLLEEWIEGCDDPTAIAIVADGLDKLRYLLDKVNATATPDAAYALKDEAHAIYGSTMDAAEGAKPKTDEPKEKTEAQKAAEALAAARKDTLAVISHKTAILASAAAAAKVPAVVEVFTTAAAQVEGLTNEAKNASTVAALGEIKARALAIFEAAKEAAVAVRDDETDGPVDTVSSYLDAITHYVAWTTEAAGGTEESPETFGALVAAKVSVLSAVDSVRSVAESGNRLGDHWNTLDAALSDFRRALVRHYIALGEPLLVSGIHIPG